MAGAQTRRPIAVTMGDPAGCGPRILAQAFHQLGGHIQGHPLVLVGDPRAFEPLIDIELIDNLDDLSSGAPRTTLPVIKTRERLAKAPRPGVPQTSHSEAIIASIRDATTLTRAGKTAALVTNPISKALLYGAGFRFPGHTEFLADLCREPGKDVPAPIMMLVGGGLRVALATIHMPLMRVGETLSQALLCKTARIVDRDLKSKFGFDQPRIAFCGLNPHAGEGGSLGDEEGTLINPAAEKLREEGLIISDARPGDTVFHEALSGAYDAVIAMTHDQGLIPVKTLDFWGGVNTTLGLPIIRTSPDHGTAYEAAAAGTCRPDSLVAALKLAAQMADQNASGVLEGQDA
ncbi:MAG: 4-hydroxythreonine-4-phosphate dehydrogenase PdxA [Pseudomonadota bacterium]